MLGLDLDTPSFCRRYRRLVNDDDDGARRQLARDVEEGGNAQHQPEADAAADGGGGGGAVAAVATMVERLSKFTPQQRKKSLSSLEHTFFHLLYSRPLILRMKKESECLLSKLLVRKPIDQA
jgi:hypothetical protein